MPRPVHATWHGTCALLDWHARHCACRSNCFKGECTRNPDSRVEHTCGLCIFVTAAPCFGLESVCVLAE
eukprot:4825244-Alexandrium_andersonii.AAC.1